MAVTLLATACAASSTCLVHRGDAALARGDFATAEVAYKEAVEKGDDNRWVVAKVERGRARIEIARARQRDCIRR